jgi:hypothetical protein
MFFPAPSRRLRAAASVFDPCTSGWNFAGWGTNGAYSSGYIQCNANYNASTYNASASKQLIPAGSWRAVSVKARVFIEDYLTASGVKNGARAFGMQWNGFRVWVGSNNLGTLPRLPGNETQFPAGSWQDIELVIDAVQGKGFGRCGMLYGEVSSSMDWPYVGGVAFMRATWGNNYVGGAADTGAVANGRALVRFDDVEVTCYI